MLNKLLVATGNQGKLKEIREILSDIEVLGLSDAGIECDVEETGTTFAENAYIKAFEISKRTGLPVLADDSGLEVEALGGRPGVYSARFAGEHATDDENVKKLLAELKDVPKDKRGARFACAMCLIFPGGRKIETFGTSCPGIIVDRKRGENGFGYDPVFFAPEYGKTFSEMTMEEKNKVSHRKAALTALSEKLKGERL
ncbi:XTP/dITP diphosphatase [Congzhengia minquanensis]|uniref:dITP/XTP pyrophosphatase n=1 Tax=Congzhengia minquanensis TaxID=2763657 RepID=A0A926DNN9_9FIRM|nr:XTP/dITP diphosphatase [Congzhengia minquanensis]MBC8541288.1 XTP/dITP diphosphatase [Congzhengia minquanensis]